MLADFVGALFEHNYREISFIARLALIKQTVSHRFMQISIKKCSVTFASAVLIYLTAYLLIIRFTNYSLLLHNNSSPIKMLMSTDK